MSIFVQIASYRDPELEPTIEDMLKEAKHPDQLTVGICRQYHPADAFDNLQPYRNDWRFRILDVPHSNSGGACWARHMVQRLFRGEEYTLQIDSHMRFAPHWDETLTGMLRTLAARGFPKPLLTGYMPSFEPGKPLIKSAAEPPLLMLFDCFTPEGILLPEADVIPDWQYMTCPIRGRFLSAGFYFTLGRFCTEVPYDPGIYFHGEEISMSVRAFTHGYDLFHPHRTTLWHYYERKGLIKHWDDHKSWPAWNDVALRRTRQLLGVDNEKVNGGFGRYGLGPVRTLKDYEQYAGVSFSERKAQR